LALNQFEANWSRLWEGLIELENEETSLLYLAQESAQETAQQARVVGLLYILRPIQESLESERQPVPDSNFFPYCGFFALVFRSGMVADVAIRLVINLIQRCQAIFHQAVQACQFL